MNKAQRNASNASLLNAYTKEVKGRVNYWKNYQNERNRSSNVCLGDQTPVKANRGKASFLMSEVRNS